MRMFLIAVGLAVVSFAGIASASDPQVEHCLDRYGTHVHPADVAGVEPSCQRFLKGPPAGSLRLAAHTLSGDRVRAAAIECQTSVGDRVSVHAVSGSFCRVFYFPARDNPDVLNIQVPLEDAAG